MDSYESVPSPGYRADREAPACGDNCDDLLGAPLHDAFYQVPPRHVALDKRDRLSHLSRHTLRQ